MPTQDLAVARSTRQKLIIVILSVLSLLLLLGLVAAVTYIGVSVTSQQGTGSDLWSCEENDCLFNQTVAEDAEKKRRKLSKEELLLPTDLRPIQYWIDIKPLLKLIDSTDEHKKFWGNVTIRLECVKPTDKIVLLYKELDITKDSIVVKDTEGRRVRVRSLHSNETNDKLTIFLDRELKKGVYMLEIINYLGKINNDGIGFYLSTYKIDNITKNLAATQFEVAGARQAFPSFDEPHFKALFTVSITRRKEFISRSNMDQIDSESQADGFMKDSYKTSVKMSTYLVAWVICNFKYIEKTAPSGVKVRAYARPNAISEVNLALDSCIRVLEYFQQYFDIKFVLSKIDLVALPDFSHGAMENWGLVTYRESAMLYDKERNTRARREDVSMITGHEIAHQWFGNLVTMHWWDDLWLNEGLACYLGYVSPNVTDDLEDMTDKFIYTNLMTPLKEDSLETTHAIVSDVYHPNDILQMFDGITYKKGASVLHMLKSILTPEVFRDGLRKYLRTHMYGNAKSNDLWAAYDKVVGEKAAIKRRMDNKSVSQIMTPWIKEIGYPYVHATKDNMGYVNVKQGRFLLNQDKRENNNQTWVIPFTYAYAGKPDFWNPNQVWIDTKKVESGTVGVPKDDWILGNVRHSAFYRVNYDDHNWMLLAKQLKSDHQKIPPVHRAQILHDTFAFAKAGMLPIHTTMDMTKYLTKEVEYLPWRTALDNFLFLDSIFQVEPTYNLYQQYAQRLITSIYERMDWRKNFSANKYDIYLRTKVVQYACFVGIKNCVERSKQYFKQWQRAPLNNPIPNDLVSVVVCTALREGGQEEWEFVWKQYLNATHESKRKIYLQNLGCTSKPWLLVRFYNKLFDRDVVRAFDVPTMMVSVQSNPAARRHLWLFVKNHWERLQRELKDLTTTVGIVFEYFTNEQDIKELEIFMKTREVKYAGNKFKQALEATKFVVNWKNEHMDSLVDWLKKYLNHDR